MTKPSLARHGRALSCAFAALVSFSPASQALDYYLTPGGAGVKDGTSWADAFSLTQLRNTLNVTLQPGDTLNIGSGSYNLGKDDRDTDIPKQFYISGKSGTATAPIRVVGHETTPGSGFPKFSKPTSNWSISNPGSGQGNIIKFSGGADYWELENLQINNIRDGVATSFDSSPTADQYVGLKFRNISIKTVRNGFYMHNCDDLLIDGCAVTEYSKRGVTLLAGCDNGLIINSVTDCVGSQVEATWWDTVTEKFPFGFTLDNRPEVNNVPMGAVNTNITFENCLSTNNRKSYPSGDDYWNGDGFVVESGHTGTQFIRCISLDNEDAGFDLKTPSLLVDCVSFENARQFRCWQAGSPFVLNNCVAGFPKKRGPLNGTGAIWASQATVNATNFTYHSVGSKGIETDQSAANVTVTDSIFSIDTASPVFNTGSGVETFVNTIKYPSGTTVAPNFVNAYATWDGQGNAMDSQQYPNLGYSSTRIGQGQEEVVDITPSDDASIRYGNYASYNYGTATTLNVRNTGVNYRSYVFLKFDVSGLGDISAAELKLVATAAPTGLNHSVALLSDNWSEATVNGNTAVTSAGTIANFIPVVGDNIIDLTSAVQTEAAGDGVISLRVICSTYETGTTTYGSKENATVSLRPVLTVTATP